MNLGYTQETNKTLNVYGVLSEIEILMTEKDEINEKSILQIDINNPTTKIVKIVWKAKDNTKN